MKDQTLLAKIEAVRHFNRFYTRQIGVLDEGLLESPFSLTEARVVYELAQRESVTASELGAELNLDAGYLSRIVRDFDQRKLLVKTPSEKDARQSKLALTAQGRKEFQKLNQLSQNQVEEILNDLTEPDQARLLSAMKTIEALLGGQATDEKYSYVLRPPQPGDFGWIVQSNGSLYAREYGWDENYEALVAQIVADFVKTLTRKRNAAGSPKKTARTWALCFWSKSPRRRQSFVC